jgi:hypothetical protein
MSWRGRADEWLEKRETDESRHYLEANVAAIRRCLEHPESGVRMVVNTSADALRGLLRGGSYLNCYDSPFVAGKERKASPTRIYVDGLLGLKDPKKTYYGAASMGGTGIRFYGEYCLVLKTTAIDDDTKVHDRNSYDLLHPPLSSDPKASVEQMAGTWADRIDMLVMKVVPEIPNPTRLMTLGTVSDAVLHDEDYVEILKEGSSFSSKDIEEIREAPEEQVVEGHILQRVEQGALPRPDEVVWVARRARVRSELTQARLRTRVVASEGRGGRWD